MGDVAALYTADGTYVGGYEYDPYGAVIAVNHNPDYADADGILEKNPFRYRGYYLDEETGWYYLNSRYYDPEVKRFINSDRAFESILTNACVNLNQYNLFAYCNDNPVANLDSSGMCDVITVTAIAFIVMSSAYLLANISMNMANDDNLKEALDEVDELIASGVKDFTVRNQSVYCLTDGDEVVYVGRTNNIPLRRYAHSIDPKRKDYDMPDDKIHSGLTKAEARFLEQALMITYHTKKTLRNGCNAINGISPTNKKLYLYFASAIKSGVIDYDENQAHDMLLKLMDGSF